MLVNARLSIMTPARMGETILHYSFVIGQFIDKLSDPGIRLAGKLNKRFLYEINLGR
jgi:hypothetical protein